MKLNNSDDSEVRGGLRYKISEDWNVSALAESTLVGLPVRVRAARQSEHRVSRRRLFQPPQAVRQRHGRIPGGHVPQRLALSGIPDAASARSSSRTTRSAGSSSRATATARSQYSISAFNPYYFDNKVGGGANIELFDHVLVRGYVEDGPNDLPGAPASRAASSSREWITSSTTAAAFRSSCPREIVLTGLVTRQIYVSNIPRENRDFTRFTAFLNFTGTYSR